MTSLRGSVGSYVAKRIESLTQTRNQSGGRAALARLRRGIGHEPGEIPMLWGEFLLELPEELRSRSSRPTRAEWAIYAALTLFAMHQQGKEETMHRKGIDLGRATARLVSDREDQERIWPRLNRVALACDMQELNYHLRQLIQILKSEDIPLDYVRLAEDLYDHQGEDTVNRVRLQWGRSFFAGVMNTDNSND